jgi:hypothetical protein
VAIDFVSLFSLTYERSVGTSAVTTDVVSDLSKMRAEIEELYQEDL